VRRAWRAWRLCGAAALLCAACDAGGRDAAAGPDAGARPGGEARDSAASWAAARRGGEAAIRVLYVPADGFAYRGGDGELTGVTIEIMRAFAGWVGERHGVRVEAEFVEEPDWRTFYGRVRDATGGVFGVGNVTITAERRRELRFSPPYLTNIAVLITHESVPELLRLEDAGSVFAGLRPLAFEGTLHERRLRELRDAYLPDAEIGMAHSNAEILERVSGGGWFAWIDAYNFWRAAEQGMPLRRHEVGDDPAEEFGVIVPHDNDWAPLLDEFFEGDGGLRNSPAYRAILERHLGPSLTRALEEARLR
jgi:hypothetical protein